MPATSPDKRFLLSFATETYRKSQALLVALAQSFGIDTSFIFTDDAFQRLFGSYIAQHERIFHQKRGWGYWLWKPFLINWLLSKLNPGDIILYADSGFIFTEDPAPLFDLAREHDQVFFSLPGQMNRQWTKRDVFASLGADVAECWNREQTAAACSLWKCCPSSIQRSKQWLELCENEYLLTDTPSVAQNLPEFVEHRHDQSILSVLTFLWGKELMLNPSQVGLEDHRNPQPYGRLALSVGAIQNNGQVQEIWSRYLEPALRRQGIR